MLRKTSEYDQEMPQSHTNPWHHEEEAPNTATKQEEHN